MNIFYILFCATALFLSVGGIYGNPTKETINADVWNKGPFEFAQRARFAMTYSLVEEGRLDLSSPMAKFGLPDIGYNNGKYISLFAPGTSFITTPGYALGKNFGASQVGTYFVIALFALFNTALIRLISEKLGASSLAATIASLIFLFATPAFSYSVNLYQHHISLFLILFSIYLLATTESAAGLLVVWFLYGLAIFVDYPNALLMLPIIFYSTAKMTEKKFEESSLKIRLLFSKALTALGLVLPLLLLLWFNKNLLGSPFQLTGTVQDVVGVAQDGSPILHIETKDVEEQLKESQLAINKSALGFFKTRNLINGLYTHLVSPDRGIIYFAPVVLFGFLGFSELRKKRNAEFSLLVSIVGVNLLLYSMWGDPWGGWSFGSRYLIPTYAMMSIFAALGIGAIRKKTFLAFLFGLVLVFSVAVNTLGAITASGNPPISEVKYLESQSGRVEKYTFERNWEFLFNRGSKSFVYNEFASKYMTAFEYYLFITGAIISVLSVPMLYLFLSKREK